MEGRISTRLTVVRAGIRSTDRTTSATSSGAIFQLALAGSGTEIRIYTARHNIRHADTVLAVVQHHRFGEAIQPELRSIVRCATGKWVLAREAADVDDRPAAALAQAAECLRCSSRTLRSGWFPSLFPFFECEVGDRAKIPRPALFTRMSNPPKRLVDELEEILKPVGIAHIHAKPGNVATVLSESSLAAPSTALLDRPQIATAAPSRASDSAIA